MKTNILSAFLILFFAASSTAASTSASTVATWKAVAVKQTGQATTNESGELIIDGKKNTNSGENNVIVKTIKTETMAKKTPVYSNGETQFMDLKEEKTESNFFWRQ